MLLPGKEKLRKCQGGASQQRNKGRFSLFSQNLGKIASLYLVFSQSTTKGFCTRKQMEEQGVQQRKSKKGKLREVRKANAYGQRLQPSQCVTYASSSSTASSSRAEDGATVTPYSKNSKGIKPQPYLRYVRTQI